MGAHAAASTLVCRENLGHLVTAQGTCSGWSAKVRWLFRIFRSTNFGGSWSQIYQSTWQNAQANDAIPARAGSGFSRRTWIAPENPTGWFKVRILMHWFNASGNRVGVSMRELVDQTMGASISRVDLHISRTGDGELSDRQDWPPSGRAPRRASGS